MLSGVARSTPREGRVGNASAHHAASAAWCRGSWWRPRCS